MRSKWAGSIAIGLVVLIGTTSIPSASAATTLPCTKGKSVKVVKGKATMIFKGKRVACVVRATPKPSPTGPAITLPQVRIAGSALSDVVIKPNLTITIRNTTSISYTLVVSGTDISVTTPANDISAFISPTKPGVYQMTTLENPNMKATLTVVN